MEMGAAIAIAVTFLVLAYVFRDRKRMRLPFLIVGLAFGVIAAGSAG
ncbi:MAG: hypothetical protein AAGF45_08865 [Pseudomonadota bacterium]